MKVVKFDHIRLEEAENGFVLEFTEVMESPNTFDDNMHVDKEFVFANETEGVSVALDKALAKMKSLLIFNMIKKEGASIVELPSLIGSTVKRI